MSDKSGVFITVIIPIITLIIGWFLNLISTKVAFKKTEELEKKKLLQTKIEEIAKLVDEIDRGYNMIWTTITPTDSFIKPTPNLESFVISFRRVKIVIDFYFPELKPIFNELIKESQKFAEEFAYFSDAKNKTNQPGILNEIEDTINRINNKCGEIISLSAEIAQKLL